MQGAELISILYSVLLFFLYSQSKYRPSVLSTVAKSIIITFLWWDTYVIELVFYILFINILHRLRIRIESRHLNIVKPINAVTFGLKWKGIYFSRKVQHIFILQILMEASETGILPITFRTFWFVCHSTLFELKTRIDILDGNYPFKCVYRFSLS